MKEYTLAYIKDNGYSRSRDLQIEIELSDNVKIQEQAINKALMIAMNYLFENMETEDQESSN